MFTDAYPAAACTNVRSARRRHDFSVFSSFKRSLLFVPASVFKKRYSCFVRCKLAYKVFVAFILILDEFTELTHRLLKPCHRPVYLYNNRHHRNKRADKRDGSRNRFPAYFFTSPHRFVVCRPQDRKASSFGGGGAECRRMISVYQETSVRAVSARGGKRGAHAAAARSARSGAYPLLSGG